MSKASVPTVHCLFTEMRRLEDIHPNPRNPNQHPDEQIELLAAIIKGQGWRQPITVSTRSELVVRGHARLEAAQLLQLPAAPVELQDYDSDELEWADLVADNRIAELAEINRSMLKDVLQEIDTGAISMDLTGFQAADLELLMTAAQPAEFPYSKNIEAPIYEPQAEEPPEVEALFDASKTDQLVEEIRAAGLRPDVEAFLTAAAARHTIFNFRNIADFYAHAEPHIQRLMESSALVIIDFHQAIEKGFVKLTEAIAEQFQEDYPDETE